MSTEQERIRVAEELYEKVYDKARIFLESEIIGNGEEGLKEIVRDICSKNLQASSLIEDIGAQRKVFFVLRRGQKLLE